MPIAFPPVERIPAYAPQADIRQFAPAFDVTNLGIIGADMSSDCLNPGMPQDFMNSQAVNLRNLGQQFTAADLGDNLNPQPRPVVDAHLFIDVTGYAASGLTGVSRDSTGAALGGCTVDLYHTPSKAWQQTTTSDASGNFFFSLMSPGPYFLVMYKAGSPDVAGTTVNTLQPA